MPAAEVDQGVPGKGPTDVFGYSSYPITDVTEAAHAGVNVRDGVPPAQHQDIKLEQGVGRLAGPAVQRPWN